MVLFAQMEGVKLWKIKILLKTSEYARKPY